MRKADGSNYEPNTLRGLMSSYERHLRRHDYEYSLTNSIQFAKLREVMKSKQRELKRQGLGNLPNKADAVTDDDIEKLWQCNQLGAANPESIINTLWFFSTIHFGTRTAEEHRNQPKRVKSLNSGQNLSHKFFGLDFCVLLFFQLLGPCLINCDV